MKKRVRTITTVNELTGEVVDQHSVYSTTLDPEPPFVKVYFGGGMEFFQLTGTDATVLLYFFEAATERHPEVILNQFSKQLIAEKAGCTTHNINYSVRKLLDRELIIRIGRGAYILNPFKVSKGYWSSISQLRDRAMVYLEQKHKNAENAEKVTSD